MGGVFRIKNIKCDKTLRITTGLYVYVVAACVHAVMDLRKLLPGSSKLV